MSIKQLIRNRNSLTQELAMLNEFATSIDTNLPTISDVEYRLTGYNDLLQEFNQLQRTIEEKCDETDLETHYETRKQFKTSFFDAMAILMNYVNKNAINVTNGTTFPNSNQSFDYIKNNFLPKIKSNISHTKDQCRLDNCKKCSKKHSTLLHIDSQIKSTIILEPSTSQTNLLVENKIPVTQVLLPTVTFQGKDKYNNFHKARAILDSGAQSNLFTEPFCQKINIPLINRHIPIIGINQSESITHKKSSINIISSNKQFSTILNCPVVPSSLQGGGYVKT
ncbi:uncharacterized protein LOC126882752 [Diabrotica virgifera virgifera]|uniref:Uncharacterized protein n=1 Tax=Diabrotica virgifera virgifera TaxID=50390 RepID=A0ABM5K0I2_DIAVI|nr:uncharacterized protein LOC126882752 [Diabrotica virgifera virgifera]